MRLPTFSNKFAAWQTTFRIQVASILNSPDTTCLIRTSYVSFPEVGMRKALWVTCILAMACGGSEDARLSIGDACQGIGEGFCNRARACGILGSVSNQACVAVWVQ